jgi:nucleoside-diphosphate-sugar epimerase
LKILLRDGDWWLGEQLAAALADDGHLTTPVPYAVELDHEEATDEIVAGSDALVVFGYRDEAGDPTAQIDHSTRQLYNLLHAASETGVGRCVYVSTLKLFDEYEENLTVTEKWRSLPPAEDVPQLACHLGEVVCKEFARDRRIQVATIRLGFPIIDGDIAAAKSSGETAAVCSADAVDAIKRALAADTLSQWQDIHVQSNVPDQRFLMHAAESLLGISNQATPLQA